MISAKKAREYTKQHIKSDIEKEMEDIEQKILWATMQGNNFVSITPPISDQAEKELRKLKYKIGYGEYRDEIYTDIRW